MEIAYSFIRINFKMDNSNFLTSSLITFPDADKVTAVLNSAINASDPAKAVSRYVRRRKNELLIGVDEIDLEDYHQIKVIGIGKACVSMGFAMKEILAEYFQGGVLITKDQKYLAPKYSNQGFVIMFGSHPVPNQTSINATKRLTESLLGIDRQSLVICLISGGGSALFTHPMNGIELADIQKLTTALLASGANIHEINTIRKHIDDVKGGRLAQLVYPAKLVTLILSDVVGNELDAIASGPTVADPTTFNDAINILEKYRLLKETSESILSCIRRGLQGEIKETVKNGDQELARVSNYLIGSVADAVDAAKTVAEEKGFNAGIITTSFQGETRALAKEYSNILGEMVRKEKPVTKPGCMIAGGESTVKVLGKGLGGRNQDLALNAVPLLDGLESCVLITLATDGEDGPTDAAGAVVTGGSAEKARSLGLNINEFISNNDSYNFFHRLGDQIKIGATGTNLNDLVFLFTTKEP